MSMEDIVKIAAEAKKHGMNYGVYQSLIERESQSDQTKAEKRCAICGKELGKRQQKFCSTKCAEIHRFRKYIGDKYV